MAEEKFTPRVCTVPETGEPYIPPDWAIVCPDGSEVRKDFELHEQAILNLSDEDIENILSFFRHTGKDAGFIDKLVMMDGQDELQDWQKIALAPANALENAAVFLWSLTSREGWEDLLADIMNIKENREGLKQLYYVFNTRLNRKQKLAIAIEYALNPTFVLGTLGRLLVLLRKTKRIPSFQELSTPRKIGRVAGKIGKPVAYGINTDFSGQVHAERLLRQDAPNDNGADADGSESSTSAQ